MSFCHTCAKAYNHHGIARHRAAHLGRGETCIITLKSGTWRYDPPERQAGLDTESRVESDVL